MLAQIILEQYFPYYKIYGANPQAPRVLDDYLARFTNGLNLYEGGAIQHIGAANEARYRILTTGEG